MRIFAEIDWFSFRENRFNQIKKEIDELSKEYILKVDEEEFKTYMHEKYRLEPINILQETEHFNEPKIKKGYILGAFGERYLQESYSFEIFYNFEGSHELLNVRPSTYATTTMTINKYVEQSKISIRFDLEKQDPNEFESRKNVRFKQAITNVGNINANVNGWNNEYKNQIDKWFNAQKKKFLSENSFFESIRLKVNPNTNTIFTTPSIKKKIIPQPSFSNKKEFSSEPTISNEFYWDIIKVMYEAGKSMERKPALYVGKDEEGLRDQFLFILETRYEGITATGETFNRNGKTDILVKYKDGTNIFVAECKIWKGIEEFNRAINQLFENYLTWRDSKTALIIFVKNKDMSNVIRTIRENILNHRYFKKLKGESGETSFSYEMALPQDLDKAVYLQVIAFHFDKE